MLRIPFTGFGDETQYNLWQASQHCVLEMIRRMQTERTHDKIHFRRHGGECGHQGLFEKSVRRGQLNHSLYDLCSKENEPHGTRC